MNPEVIGRDDRAGLTPGMFAAGRHFFGLKGGKRISLVRPDGPLPPTWQRTEVQAAALLAAMLLIIVVSEVTLAVQYAAVKKDKAEIDQRASVLDEAVARIEKQREAIEAQKAELEAQKESQRRMEARLRFFGQELPERALLVQAVLGILQNNVDDQIIVYRLDEMGRRVGLLPSVLPLNKPGVIETDNFNIDAWALTESAAQSFVQNMKQSVAAWDMEVRDIQVIEKTGPLNLNGYAVSISLVRVIPEAKSEDKQV